MKLVAKLFYNSLLGGVVLLLINLIGSLFNFYIALNIASSIIVGILGLPGVCLLLLLKYLL